MTADGKGDLGVPVHNIPPDHIARRRDFEDIAADWGYVKLRNVGFEGEWVSPIQKVSGHPTGPLLLAKDYLDAPSLISNRSAIASQGYLPGNPFNKVIDLALKLAGLAREDIYIAQCFAALVPKDRSTSIPAAHLRTSFEMVAYHELQGRQVLALGPAAIELCKRYSIKCEPVAHHPSARGKGLTTLHKAKVLAAALETSALGKTATNPTEP